MIKLYVMQEKSDSKIIICDVSAYNTHPDLRPDFRRKNAYYTRKITVYQYIISGGQIFWKSAGHMTG